MSNLTFDMRGLIENSLLEWEDKVAAVAIAGGCNLRCPYCHSWRYVTGLEDLLRLDPQALFDLLDRQRGWLDGVVVTGGEPTLQPGLGDLLRRCREYDVAIKLHTNGTRPEVLRALLAEGLVDCLALDYKAPLDERWYAAVGLRSNPAMLDAVRESFSLAAGEAWEREYHTTLDPAFVSGEVFVDMAAELEPEGLWILQQFETGDCLDPVAAGGRRYTNEELDALTAMAAARHGRVLLKRGSSA